MGVTSPLANCWSHLQVGLGYFEVIATVAGMGVPKPLFFGGPVGTRRELTPLKENEEECGFYGLVIAHTLNA